MKTYYNGQRSRRQEGTPPGNQGERRSDPNEDKAYNENLRVQQLRAKRLEKRANDAKTDEEKAAVEYDRYNFEQDTGSTTGEILKLKPRVIPGTRENLVPRDEIRKLGVKPRDEEA
tara:strand:- start:1087 stop:1434 length:348 start_codon:yes stop_codon:yes gene_type:complete